MLFKTISASVYGIDGFVRMQDFNVVGLPDNSVKESRDRGSQLSPKKLWF